MGISRTFFIWLLLQLLWLLLWLGVVIAEWLLWLLLGVGGGGSGWSGGGCCCCWGGGGDSGQLLIGCGGGLELLRTLVCELELEEDCDDEEEEDEADADADAAPDILAADDAVDMVEAAVEPAVTTWMGCGGGESGELIPKRFGDVVATGGGDSGISTMGLGERVGVKSDWPLERKMPLRTGQGAWLDIVSFIISQ